MNITPLSQRDARWRDEIIAGDLTLGTHGCTLTCLTMFLNQCGYPDMPPDVLRKVRENGGIMQEGLIIWNAVDKAYPAIGFISRDYGLRPDYDVSLTSIPVLHSRAKKLIRCGLLPLIQVRFGANSVKPDHWVLGVKSEPLTIIDPWDGVEIDFRTRYGDPDAQMLGLASYFGPVAEAEDADRMNSVYKAYGIKKGWERLPLDLRLKIMGISQEISTYSRELFDDAVR